MSPEAATSSASFAAIAAAQWVRVVSPKPVCESQIGGVRHECLVEFDHVDGGPQILQNGPSGADLAGCDVSDPLSPGKCGHCLDVGQSCARDAVGRVPELTAIP